MKTRFSFVSFVLAVLVGLNVVGCKQDETGPVAVSTSQTTPSFSLNASTSSTTTSEHLILGNPSNAVADTSSGTNYLMVKPQYVLSYNKKRCTPNWVAWHLSTDWLGSASRSDNFRADSTLPKSWYWVTTSSYTSSGYDRGHQCPSADRTNTSTNNSATFLMTNIMPQLANLNQGPWEVLEDSCRALVNNKGMELYIYSGGYDSVKTINSGHIVVPKYCWKIIVVLPAGSNDLSRVTTSTRVIAVWMSNTSISKTANWKSYRVSVDYIESKTGYDFLSNVSTSIQSVIEAKTDAL
jgi:endonuclease G